MSRVLAPGPRCLASVQYTADHTTECRGEAGCEEVSMDPEWATASAVLPSRTVTIRAPVTSGT